MKILIIGPSWVGDTVMAQSLFIAIKNRRPDACIDVLAPAWSHPVLARMAQVNQRLLMPLGHGTFNLLARREIGVRLRSQGYDQAIILPNSYKSALVPWFGNIPRRTGWRGEMRYGLINDLRVLDKQSYPLMVQRFVALALPKDSPLPDPLPYPSLRADPNNIVQTRSRLQLNSDRPILALCPGAEFGESKRWPAKHYAQVAQQKISDGYQIWLFGSAADQPITNQIIEHMDQKLQRHCLNLAGDTSIEEAVDLMSLAAVVVTNDSGLMHIAAALKLPLIAVYGSSSPDFTPPLTDKAMILRTGIDCSPCFKRTCPLQHMKCLNELPATSVVDALGKMA